MCGLAGFMRVGAAARGMSADELVALRDGMARRGPDDAGLWLDAEAGVGLAHRRLSIIDLSAAGHQPMQDPETGNQIVFNGEIYNFRALADELRAAGCMLRTNSDTEVILQLYRREGVAMLRRLRGMFAFAIWDARERALVLARDPYGIKPLYYAEVDGTFVFASQVRALRRLPDLRTRPPLPAAKVAFLLFGYVPEPITFFTDIASVPAGGWQRVDTKGVAAPVGYSSVAAALQQPLQGPPRPAKPQILAALEDSVRHHMVADVPVGVFLSAGRDSSVIAAAASRCVAEPLRTVTLSFEEFSGTPFDEAPLAEATAAALGTDHRTIRVRRADFEQELDRILGAMDQPTIDGINVYFVSKAAAESGLKVALSGLGADELFGGYAHFRSIPRVVSLCRPFGRSVGRALRQLASPFAARVASPKYAGVVEYGTRVGDAYLLSRALFAPWELADVLDPDEVDAGLDALAERTAFNETDCWSGSEHAHLVALESTWYMRNQLLRDADWASMAHSLEVRVPFVDHVLLGSLAPLIAGTNPPDKADMLAPFQSRLPAAVAARSKTGFGVPVHQWLLEARPGSAVQSRGRRRGLRPWAMHVYQHFMQHV